MMCKLVSAGMLVMLSAAVAEGGTRTDAGRDGKPFRTAYSYGTCHLKKTAPKWGTKFDREYLGCMVGKYQGFDGLTEIPTGEKREIGDVIYECKSSHKASNLNVEPWLDSQSSLKSDHCYYTTEKTNQNIDVAKGQFYVTGKQVFQCVTAGLFRNHMRLKPWGCVKEIPGSTAVNVPFGNSWVVPAGPGAAENLLSTRYFCDKDATDGTHKIQLLKNKNGCEIKDPDNEGKTRLIKLGDSDSYDGVVSKCELAKDKLSAELIAWGCVKPGNWAGEDTLEFGKGGVWKGEPMDFGPLPFTVYPTYTCEKQGDMVSLNPHTCQVNNESFGPGCSKVFGDFAVVCREEKVGGKKTGTLQTTVVYASERNNEPEKDCKK